MLAEKTEVAYKYLENFIKLLLFAFFMEQKIVVVDFSGTLIQPFVAEQANLKRYALLGISKPSQEEHKKLHGTKKHYDIIKQHVEKNFGISDAMQISFVQSYGREIVLSGKDVKTMMMTDLFRNCMYAVAREYGKKIFVTGMIASLQRIQKKGYKLAIVSGVRKDIITGMLAIVKCPLQFDYIYAQDPVLSRDDNQQLNNELAKKGKIAFLIGDKLDDLKPAKSLKAKSIFVTWGHPVGNETSFADYVVKTPKALEHIIS
ncbi:HAD family hydrolase [Candidatus Woesearchaeota archaeon]|nr:MAG: HAD family hydrolase [Candidatus Woesearchaeota archaeon]